MNPVTQLREMAGCSHELATLALAANEDNVEAAGAWLLRIDSRERAHATKGLAASKPVRELLIKWRSFKLTRNFLLADRLRAKLCVSTSRTHVLWIAVLSRLLAALLMA